MDSLIQITGLWIYDRALSAEEVAELYEKE